MVRGRLLALLAGGAGLLLFVGAMLLMVMAGPDPSCAGNLRCEREAFDRLEMWILLMGMVGLILVASGSALLWREREARKPKKPPVVPRPPVRPPR